MKKNLIEQSHIEVTFLEVFPELKETFLKVKSLLDKYEKKKQRQKKKLIDKIISQLFSVMPSSLRLLRDFLRPVLEKSLQKSISFPMGLKTHHFELSRFTFSYLNSKEFKKAYGLTVRQACKSLNKVWQGKANIVTVGSTPKKQNKKLLASSTDTTVQFSLFSKDTIRS